jgi:Asp/Glu/hydantoin racemase
MIDERLSEAIDVPGVNPVKAAAKTAEMLVEMGVTHSKLVYPVPPSLRK